MQNILSFVSGVREDLAVVEEEQMEINLRIMNK